MAEEARGGFVVPEALLRLAEDVDRQPSTADPAARRGAHDPRAPDEATPGLYAALVLTAATAITLSPLAAVWRLGPSIERALHIGGTGLEGLTVAAAGAALLSAPALAWAARRWGPRRVAPACLAGVALGTATGAAAPSLAVLAVGLIVVGVCAGAVPAIHVPAVVRAYGGRVGVRALAGLAAAFPIAGTLGIAVSGALGSAANWRAGLLVGLLGLPGAALMVRLELPPATGAVTVAAQRVRRLRSQLALIVVASVLAFVAVGGPVVVTEALEHRWHQGLGGQHHALFVAALGLIAGVLVVAAIGERLEALSLASGGLVVFGVGSACAAAVSNLALAEAGWAVAAAGLVGVGVGGAVLVADVARPGEEGAMMALLGAWGLAAGGAGATLVLSALSQADDPRLALAAVGACGLVAAGIVMAAAGAHGHDVAATHADAASSRRPSHGHALDIRGVNFAYGARQVLFNVDLQVEEGEVAALLGTNGAGKSTLLRVVAGLDHPSSGSIRVWGEDSTYLEAEQVVGLGVGLLPGGRMSFPGLTVMENLRVGGHLLRHDSPRLRAGIDEVMAMFPVLSQRRDQRVGTLSGGEQQMLALGRVLLTKPRLLMIDELTLGLAPFVVESLLEIIRRINEGGTTVLLVEQSANLALSLARHGVFLERGAIRFDGATAELLERDDLLRPVFLGGP